jgi:hypothetical protein
MGMKEIQEAIGEAALKDHADKARAALIEITTKTYDKAAAFTNIIMVAGYAAAFTIWAYTRAQLPPRANIIVALALLVSVVTFVAFEVLKMVVSARIFMRTRKVLVASSTPTAFLRAVEEAKRSDERTLLRFMPIWRVVLTVCALAALVAFLLLLYNFVALLLGWPQWPH